MPTRQNRDVSRKSESKHVLYTPPLQPDNTPWTPHQPVHLDSSVPLPSDASHRTPQKEAEPSSKHEGVILPGPLSPLSPEMRRLSSTRRLSGGHISTPVLAHEPTMLETFSRAFRNYSIPIPSTTVSSPRASRPVSLGSFGALSGTPGTPPDGRRISGTPSATRRRPSASSAIISGAVELHDEMAETEASFESDEDTGVTPLTNPSLTVYPTVSEGDAILWSRWDMLTQQGSSRRVLFLGYSSGLQVWDCTELGSVSEILNLVGPMWEYPTFASILVPPPLVDDSQLKSQRPLIGIICHTKGESFMVIYSLRSHEIVKRLSFRDVSSFVSCSQFTVISTANPPTLHILSSASFTILHTISSLTLAYNRTSTHKSTTHGHQIVSLSQLDSHNTGKPVGDDFVPVYCLSRRLLAFASQPPRSGDRHHGSRPASQPLAHSRSSSNTFGLTQAELGSTAARVGGTMFNGMKSLGGMAFNAAAEYARSRVMVPPPNATGAFPKQDQFSLVSGLGHLFFSRSAPATSGDPDRAGRAGLSETDSRRKEALASQDEINQDETNRWSPLRRGIDSYVQVLDLAPLLDHKVSAPPEVVAEFVAVKHQPISHLKFTHDGNSLLVAPKDGQVIRMFQLRPMPRIARLRHEVAAKMASATGSPADMTASSAAENAPWHVYNLRRGRTSAVIEGIEISPDGRWIAIGTRKPTVHIFAVNPYGGHPDARSHTGVRIWNADKPQPLSTELGPITRLRAAKAISPDSLPSGVSFTFISGDDGLSGNLLPPPSGMASSPSTSSARSDLGSYSHSSRVRNYKDVLLFDSSRGVLSLRRIAVEQRPLELGATFSVPIVNFATSISLPGAGAAGRLITSSSQATKYGRKASELTQQLLEASTRLVGKESAVAIWHMRRRPNWGEVKHVLYEQPVMKNMPVSESVSLAHAELSTFSRSAEMVSRQIYLSHQFLFYSLGEDYHALIRQHRFGMIGHKIEVRREVEPSMYNDGKSARMGTGISRGGGADELFIADTVSGHDLRGITSSLDEPLANALTSDLEAPLHATQSIPMFPNGAPGLRSTGTSLPIRSLTGGVGEGIERLRREMHRVRRTARHEEGSSVLRGGRIDAMEGDGYSAVSGQTGESLPTSSVRSDLLGVGDEATAAGKGVVNVDVMVGARSEDGEGEGEGEVYRGWDWAEEDKRAIDEAEQFDDVLGFMDEDQTPAARTAGDGPW